MLDRSRRFEIEVVECRPPTDEGPVEACQDDVCCNKTPLVMESFQQQRSRDRWMGGNPFGARAELCLKAEIANVKNDVAVVQSRNVIGDGCRGTAKRHQDDRARQCQCQCFEFHSDAQRTSANRRGPARVKYKPATLAARVHVRLSAELAAAARRYARYGDLGCEGPGAFYTEPPGAVLTRLPDSAHLPVSEALVKLLPLGGFQLVE